MSGEPTQPLPLGALLLLSLSTPQVARRFPEPMPVTLKVRLGATPVATLRTNNATLQLQPFVEVQAVTSNSAFQSLFSFDVVSEVGWWGWLGGWQLPRSHFLPHFPQLLCSIHDGLPAVPSLCHDIPGVGPLHVLLGTVPGTLFPLPSAWLASPHLSRLSSDVAAFLRQSS